jgi:hypothetical protein
VSPITVTLLVGLAFSFGWSFRRRLAEVDRVAAPTQDRHEVHMLAYQRKAAGWTVQCTCRRWRFDGIPGIDTALDLGTDHQRQYGVWREGGAA